MQSLGALRTSGFDSRFISNVFICLIGIATHTISHQRQGNLLPPFSVAYTKGFKRCTVLLITLQGIRELNLAEEVPHHIKAGHLV